MSEHPPASSATRADERSTDALTDSPSTALTEGRLLPDRPSTIWYSFLPGRDGGTDTQKQKVRASIDEWTHYANVDFAEVVDAGSADVKIVFDPHDGSWSSVRVDRSGVAAGSPSTNLTWESGTSGTSNERAVIMHEFEHELGLQHENRSAAHGAGDVIDVQAALDIYRAPGGHGSDREVYDQVMSMYNTTDVSSDPLVDEWSIMHKRMIGQEHDIGFNAELSDVDKAYMVLQYPRATPHERAPEWTFEHALDVIRCPDPVRNAILQAKETDVNARGSIDPSNIRRIL
ncbi:uncharacterized protein SRS1_21007 [Sporisorium reilianum f. sp. reilianum]|uniref:Peptidase metallopeptidase domain-containing protein n=1 Tax=Sporisorium reilianum f. sp. reilianum TaxID=72559 RepID=A0A2N8UHV7_9BASI|nr:uncharacterized protein SRS1_21007 [Sporisorium reilianum f. sp. reilianum]